MDTIEILLAIAKLVMELNKPKKMKQNIKEDEF
jgi:hypothetical protein